LWLHVRACASDGFQEAAISYYEARSTFEAASKRLAVCVELAQNGFSPQRSKKIPMNWNWNKNHSNTQTRVDIKELAEISAQVVPIITILVLFSKKL